MEGLKAYDLKLGLDNELLEGARISLESAITRAYAVSEKHSGADVKIAMTLTFSFERGIDSDTGEMVVFPNVKFRTTESVKNSASVDGKAGGGEYRVLQDKYGRTFVAHSGAEEQQLKMDFRAMEDEERRLEVAGE